MSDGFDRRDGSDATGERTADRAVSEVISFALIFSLIVATVALVYVSGIGGLEDTRSSEQVNNAERAFDVLADNIGDIHRQAAPSRATEIKVSDAQMEFADPVRINITIRNKLGDGNTSVVEYQPIVYSADSGTELLYSNGALLREDRGGAVLNKNPPFLFTYDAADDEKTAILPVIETRNDGPESTGSQRTVLVRTLLAIREVTIAEDDPDTASLVRDTNPDSIHPNGDSDDEYEVTIRLQTSEPRRDVWLDYLNDRIAEQDDDGASFDVRDIDGDTDSSNDPACEVITVNGVETIECSIAVENIYSTATRVDVIYR